MTAWLVPLLVVQILSCFFMTGVIWIVQLVHYPSFEFADRSRFAEFHEFHASRITWVVGPVMLAELLSAAGLCFSAEQVFLWNLGLVLSLWALTGFVSVPLHNGLVRFFDGPKVRWLVLTNWARTILWTLRSLVLGWGLMRILLPMGPSIFSY